MNEPKHYRDDLLEWCKIAELNWESTNIQHQGQIHCGSAFFLCKKTDGSPV